MALAIQIRPRCRAPTSANVDARAKRQASERCTAPMCGRGGCHSSGLGRGLHIGAPQISAIANWHCCAHFFLIVVMPKATNRLPSRQMAPLLKSFICLWYDAPQEEPTWTGWPTKKPQFYVYVHIFIKLNSFGAFELKMNQPIESIRDCRLRRGCCSACRLLLRCQFWWSYRN